MQTFSVTTLASGGGSENSAHSVPKPMVLASHESTPLSDDLRVVNKVSQNLHAELALRLLGKEKGTSGSIQGGLEVLRGFLDLGRHQARPIRVLRRFRTIARKPRDSCGGRPPVAVRPSSSLGARCSKTHCRFRGLTARWATASRSLLTRARSTPRRVR